jgi:regulator of replication initiation timing
LWCDTAQVFFNTSVELIQIIMSDYQNNEPSASAGGEQNARIGLIITILLLVLSVAAAIYFWKKSSDAGLENARISETAQSLELEKAMIERSLDSLSIEYGNLRSENEDLRGKEAVSAELIAQKDAAVQKIKSQNKRQLNELRVQVEELRKLKIEYETLITALQVETAQLRAENQRLTEENQQLQGENSELTDQVGDLAKKLEDQIRKTQSAKFKATAFRVELGRKNDKQTVRAKKAREITVSFDLADVPSAYHGDQHLYLAITDEKGKPISSAKPVKTSIDAPSGKLDIEAQQVKAVSLGETQRLSFTYKLDEKLKRGNYVAAIYCNVGLLGVSSFKLN